MASLYTPGGELYDKNGKEYVGYYHMMGNTPMVGARHEDGNEELFYDSNLEEDSVTTLTVNASTLPGGFSTAQFSEIFQTTFSSDGVFFNPQTDVVEFDIFSENKELISSNGNSKNYTIPDPTLSNGNIANTSNTSLPEIVLNPEQDVINGIGNTSAGSYFIVYNFIKYLLTPDKAPPTSYFISDISPDRTEIRVRNSDLSNSALNNLYISYNLAADENPISHLKIERTYYEISNIQLEVNSQSSSFLIKLLQSLPDTVSLNTPSFVVQQISESEAFNIILTPSTPIIPKNYIKGPNLNLKVKDRVGSSTDFISDSILSTTTLTSSIDQLKYFSSQSSIQIYPSYSISNYSDFVHFSSAEERLKNFYYKAGLIESYQNQIDIIDSITSTSPTEITSSRLVFENNISDLISNFDGFEYFLYFESGSEPYPKVSSTYPYTLQSTGSTEVLEWLGSTDISNIYYGGALLSASLYDENNSDYLFYSIPEFIRSNPENNNYKLFIDMMGQLFDEVWLYTRAVTNKLNSTNELTKGADLSLTKDILRSFGQEVYGSQFNDIEDFSSLIGVSSEGSITPPTGSELITNFVTASNEIYPLKRVEQEIHKRLYHNLVNLYKRKGTKEGLRQLINIYGIPDTILRINEFGGKDKVNINDWDEYRNIYNKEIVTHQFNADRGKEYNGGIETEWKINPLWSASAAVSNLTGSVPSTVEFRFKSDINPAITPSQSISLQPLWGLKDNTGDTKVLVYLEYNGSGSASGSYSGSILDPNYQYADLTLAISGSPPTSASISLPFYNQDWWNVRVQMQELGLTGTNQARYQIASANKIYNGDDGTKIGFTGSIKYNEISGSWVNSTTSSFSLGRTFNSVTYPNFSGSLQEIRYWTLCFNNQSTIDENVWDNHVMNPLSFETGYLTGSLSPVEHLIFRSREGEDLSLTSGSQGDLTTLTSIHPKVTGSFPLTSSFISNSSYNLISSSINSNREIQFLNQPVMGIRNRVDDKIKIVNNDAYGNVLSPYRSIQQNYEASQSYTEDINLLEVAFSPQNEINDDIIAELGFNEEITNQLADPRYLSSSLDYYTGLRNIALKYFEKYTKANPNDYYRLIKYIDNSLFKIIKDYVPARTSVSTGIVVKQHLLERNRVRPPQVNPDSDIAKTSEGGFNTPLTFRDITLTGSVKSQPKGFTSDSSIEKTTGGTGGSFEKFNNIDFTPYGVSGSGPTEKFGYTISQSFTETFFTLSGSAVKTFSTQDEFYNGEFSGSHIIVTTQSLNPGCDPFKNVSIQVGELNHQYDRFIYEPRSSSVARFNHPNTAPRTGEIFLYKGLGVNRFERIKISNTTKAGTDLSLILPDVTNITLNFDGSNKNINVAFNGGGSNYTSFNVVSPLFNYDPANFTSNFINYSASANKTSSLSNIRESEDVGSGFEHFIYTVPINSYDTETDPSNLFDISSGVYTSPLTNNRILTITGSISGSYTFENDDNTNGVSYNFRARLINVTQGDILKQNGFSVGQSAGSTSTQQFNYTLQSQLLSSQALVNNDQVRLECSIEMVDNGLLKIGTGSLNISSSTFAINQIDVTDADPVSTITAVEPAYLGDNTDFIHAFDCQPLLNNAIEIRPGTLYTDVDYSTGLLNPTNINTIINNDQDLDPALTPDSNYTSKTRTLPRYEGVKLSSAVLNKYTPPNQLILSDGTLWGGDISYGKEPVIEQTKPSFGYFQLLAPTSPEIENATQVKLKYIIDGEGQPLKPLLNSPSFFDVEGTFESKNQVDIALENTLQTDDPSLTNAAAGINLDTFNTDTTVLRGARRIDPILTTQVASIFDNDFTSFFSESISFTNPDVSTNFSFQGGEFSTKTYSSTTFATTFVISASNEGYDPAGLYTPTTSTWKNSTGNVFGNETRMRFRFQGNILNSSTADGSVKIEWVRVGLPNVFFDQRSYTAGTSRVFNDGSVAAGLTPSEPDLLTPYFSPGVNDEVRVRFDLSTLGDVDFSNCNFYGEPEFLPEVEISGSFWRTGSLYPNSTQLTSSRELAQYYNTSKQIQYPSSTFKPINEPFTVKVGDEFRFLGTEDKVHIVNDVSIINTGTETGNILVNVQPPVVNGINLSQFLIRRYNPDGTSVLIDLDPPRSGFGTTKGVIKNISINEELEENIGNILSKLSEEGTI